MPPTTATSPPPVAGPPVSAPPAPSSPGQFQPPPPAPMQLNPVYTQNNKLAIASVILGIISIPASLLTLFTVAIPIIGVVLGILSIKKQRGLAIAGIILSSIGIALTIGLLVFGIMHVKKNGTSTSKSNSTSQASAAAGETIDTDCYSVNLPNGLEKSDIQENEGCKLKAVNKNSTEDFVVYKFEDEVKTEAQANKYFESGIEGGKSGIESAGGHITSEKSVTLDGAKAYRISSSEAEGNYKYGETIYALRTEAISTGVKATFYAIACDSQSNKNCLDNVAESWKWK